MSALVKLSPTEALVFTAWVDVEQETGFSFKEAAARSGVPHGSIRRAVRALARKGLLRYERALFNEDGDLLGGGYVITREGVERIEASKEGEP